MLAHQGFIVLVWFIWTIVLNHCHNELWRREGELVCHDLRNRPFLFSLSIFFSFFLSNSKLCERHPVMISCSQGVQSHILNYSCFCLIHLTIICSFIHTPLPPLSSFYYLRHTKPLFHPSFSSPFRWKLDSHSSWQWHIAAVCHHIPSTQHVLANSPRVCLPLHLFFPSLFIHPVSTFSRWPPPSLLSLAPTIARYHHFIYLSLFGQLAS